MNEIEISIPYGASEVILKTAGKYCNNDIRVSTACSFNVVRGSFTPETDTNELSLSIPTAVKAIEIIPQGTPDNPDGKYAVRYACGVQFIGDNAHYKAGSHFAVDYYSGSKYVRSYYQWNTTNGLSATMDSLLVFRAGVTYNWTAYYWND